MSSFDRDRAFDLIQAQLHEYEAGRGFGVDELVDDIEAECVRTVEGADRELLTEALSRLEALDMLPGDPGGPFYVRDASDLMMAMRWITPVRTDPPSWGADEDDPLSRVQDLEMTQAVDERAHVLLGRIRDELFRYYDRVAKRDPALAAAWHPWWRNARRPT